MQNEQKQNLFCTVIQRKENGGAGGGGEGGEGEEGNNALPDIHLSLIASSASIEIILRKVTQFRRSHDSFILASS